MLMRGFECPKGHLVPVNKAAVKDGQLLLIAFCKDCSMAWAVNLEDIAASFNLTIAYFLRPKGMES